MKLRKYFSVTDGVYKVSLRTESFSEVDQQLMAKFGEPEIDVGGSFTGPPAFELPADLRRIRSESPFTMKFDSDDYVDADERAETWSTEMSTKIADAMTTLRANTDDFTKEEVENI
jgi:hypothetical protein